MKDTRLFSFFPPVDSSLRGKANITDVLRMERFLRSMVIKTISDILLTATVAAIPACVLAGTASATVVTVTVLNPDFSSPTLPVNGQDNTYGGGFAPGADNAVVADWGITGGGGVSTLNPSNGSKQGIVGTQIAFADTTLTNSYADTTSNNTVGADLYQDVGALRPNTTYSLTVSTGFNNSYSTGEYGVLELVNGTSDSGIVLNSVTYTPLDMSWPWSFEDINLSYATGSTVQGDLTLVLGTGAPQTGVHDVGFNNVRLTATAMPGLAAGVPEPMTLGLFGVGGTLGLLLLKRRKA